MRLLSRPYAQLSKCLLNGPFIKLKWDINLRFDTAIETVLILLTNQLAAMIFVKTWRFSMLMINKTIPVSIALA